MRCTSGSEPRSRTRRIHASGRVGTVDAPHLLSPCLSPSRSRTTASAKGLEPARLSPCGQWLRPGARTSFPCAAVRVSSLTHTLGAATAARRGRRSVLPPLNVLPRWAPPPRDAGSRTHSMPGARTGAQGHVGGVGAGCARVEATPQPPRPECAHHLDTLHHNTTGQQAMAGRARAQAGRRGARRPLAGVSVQLVLWGTRLGHPQEQSTVVAFLFVVLQTCIRYLVKREIPDLEKSIP